MALVKKKDLVLTDFDGTICTQDIGNETLSKFTDKSWDEIDRNYVKGKIGSRAAYEMISPLMKGNRKKMQRFVLEKGKLTPGFFKFYRLCKKNNLDMKIVSDGLNFYISAILEEKGFSDIEFFSNKAEFGVDDSFAITFPMINELCGRCGTCKSRLLHSYRLIYDRIIYIGNGQSDLCPSRCADLVFAKGVLLQKHQEEGRNCVPFDDFSDICDYMNKNYL
jgi:2-hydroxy-3-keto-5-methylthiopentenyl-1-phosphate phosphatase